MDTPDHAASAARYRLCLLQGGLTVLRFWVKPTSWQVIPVEVLAWAPIGVSNFETAAAWYGLVFDDADCSICLQRTFSSS
jgi:hypothetical protein